MRFYLSNPKMILVRIAMAIFGTKITPLYRAHRREQENLRRWGVEQARRRLSLELLECGLVTEKTVLQELQTKRRCF